MLSKQTQSSCYLLLTWFNQPNIISVVEQCDALLGEEGDKDSHELHCDTGLKS